MEPIVTHISDVTAYKSCRRRHSWSSRYHSNLEPKRPYAPFFTGSAVHYCIEELRSEGVAPLTSLSKYLRNQLVTMRKDQQLWLVERPAIRQQVKLIKAMIEQYMIWARNNRGPFSDANMEALAHECTFGPESDPISGETSNREKDFPGVLLKSGGKVLWPPVMIAGKFDGLERRKSDGTLWVAEYKTCRGIEERAALLQHDEQATTYVYAASELFGEPVSGIVYTLLRKKAPATPDVLKSGHLSANKNIDTTVAAFRRAIKQHYGTAATEAFIQKQYGEVLANIAAFGKPFVARVAIERTPQQLDLFVEELHATVVEMNNPATPMYANRTWSCPGCMFRQPCLARDMGQEDRVELLLGSEFRSRDGIFDLISDPDKM